MFIFNKSILIYELNDSTKLKRILFSGSTLLLSLAIMWRHFFSSRQSAKVTALWSFA